MPIITGWPELPCKFVIVNSSFQISPRLNSTWLSGFSDVWRAETEARVHFGELDEVPGPASAIAHAEPAEGADAPL